MTVSRVRTMTRGKTMIDDLGQIPEFVEVEKCIRWLGECAETGHPENTKAVIRELNDAWDSYCGIRRNKKDKDNESS